MKQAIKTNIYEISDILRCALIGALQKIKSGDMGVEREQELISNIEEFYRKITEMFPYYYRQSVLNDITEIRSHKKYGETMN